MDLGTDIRRDASTFLDGDVRCDAFLPLDDNICSDLLTNDRRRDIVVVVDSDLALLESLSRRSLNPLCRQFPLWKPLDGFLRRSFIRRSCTSTFPFEKCSALPSLLLS